MAVPSRIGRAKSPSSSVRALGAAIHPRWVAVSTALDASGSHDRVGFVQMTEDAVRVGGALVLKAPSHADGVIQPEGRLRAPLLNQVTNGAPESYPGSQAFQRLNRRTRSAMPGAGEMTAMARPWRQIVITSPASTRSNRSAKCVLASSVPTSVTAIPQFACDPSCPVCKAGSVPSNGSGLLHEVVETGAARRHGDARWAARGNGPIALAAGISDRIAPRRCSPWACYAICRHHFLASLPAGCNRLRPQPCLRFSDSFPLSAGIVPALRLVSHRLRAERADSHPGASSHTAMHPSAINPG